MTFGFVPLYHLLDIGAIPLFIVCLFVCLVDWLMAASGRAVFLPYRLSPFLEVWVCFHVMMTKFLPPLFVCTLKITS